MTSTDYDTIIVGGGFYGCSLATHLARTHRERVLVLEAGAEILQRASYVNQARVHHGYHYPRSLLTGLRSSLNFPRFISDFADCVTDGFDKYYAIARSGSHVTAEQFTRFCERISAPLEPAAPEVADLFDRRHVERVFRVREYAFDARRLRLRMLEEMRAAEVELRVERPVRRMRPISGGIRVEHGVGERDTVTAARVFTCVYSRTNRVLADSGIAALPLKHELTEVALAELPEPLAALGVTVMCGPFFSFMPFPSLGVHSFTHVRYTPHAEWHDSPAVEPPDPYAVLERVEKRSRFLHMVRDAQRYIPALGEARHVGSLWEIKTVLPRSEMDDSRPILFRRDVGMPDLSCIIGSKIDCIYDVMDEIRALSIRQPD